MTQQMNINPEQRAVINAIDDNLLVVAPFGTGKTSVLVERTLQAVQQNVDPGRILNLTFTNRAAWEMNERFAKVGNPSLRPMTFHGFCARMLFLQARDIGLPREFLILDERDSELLLSECGHAGGFRPKEAHWLIAQLKSECDIGTLQSWQISPDELAERLPKIADMAHCYQRRLQQLQALDFSDLVLNARGVLRHFPILREQWSKRYDFIQVDEMQDTHFSEYEVVQVLATGSRSIAMVGDYNQTIYEWRGSRPRQLIERYQEDFAPVQVHHLLMNYRATPKLLHQANRVANRLDPATTACVAAEGGDSGHPVFYRSLPTLAAETRWVADNVRLLYDTHPDLGWKNVGVLTRTNQMAVAVSNEFKQRKIPHVTVEQFQFFRRQEIKDALAWMRLLVQPHDHSSLNRVLERPPAGIPRRTRDLIAREGRSCGLRLTDLIDQSSLQYGEPFVPLLRALDQGELVVFDLETTGLDLEHDEVVQLVARKLVNGVPGERFEALLKPKRPVGESFCIHGFSDKELAEKGKAPREVLRDFLHYIGQTPIMAGHNIRRFDMPVLIRQIRHYGFTPPSWQVVDTLELSHRFVDAPAYNLATLAELLALKTRPSHNAHADVEATLELLIRLAPRIGEQASERRRLISDYGHLFQSLARRLTGWRLALHLNRPEALLKQVLDESGLKEYYRMKRENRRLEHLNDLRRFLAINDPPQTAPLPALNQLLQLATLTGNVDFLSPDDDTVRVMTIHQAKGLEFDAVFLPGLSQQEFPSWQSLDNGDISEEKRLFYVAITRARRFLVLSSHQQNHNGSDVSPSGLLNMLDLEAIHILGES